MPKPLRRKLPLLRYLFPHTHQRARAHLSKLRHETLPSLKHRTQSRIYRYILYRQALKLKRKPNILQRIRGQTRKLIGTSHEHEARLRRTKLTTTTNGEPQGKAMSYQDDYAPREPGTRRRKLAGYLKAANELRQTYQQQYAPGWTRSEGTYEYEDDAGGFSDAAIVRNGDEELILFPSYARKHVKKKPEAEPGTIQEVAGDGRDVRDSSGAGDAEFWKQQWENYEDDNAIVDVDVRGWIYSPHKGHMSRKQRLFIGLARQLVGISAPPAGTKPSSASDSPRSSRDPSPGQLTHRERAQMRQAQIDDQLAAREAEEVIRKGEKEAAMAAKGAYSERPADDAESMQEYRTQGSDNLRTHSLSRRQSNSSLQSIDSSLSPQKRQLWNQPADMSPSEQAEAHARLMARLRHFLAIPMANTPISIFFYNDEISKQRTVYTDASGHFNISASLDFVPTHVRILASDKLSATEEVIVTESKGVSVISDIDDTIKHSAISSGAREIFRNTFIRDLGDLTIDGVREWYNNMAELGVKFHYVSNSPWQLYPVISKYFSLAGLPPGSFHLKQYSGMLQGIFEPVAERKKGTLDKIARDFPERKFILIGDSGEADLEVYTDFVLENPGRVIAVFIRDVTTTESGGFFDPSIGSLPSDRSSTSRQESSSGSNGMQASSENDDPEYRAAIAASLREMEEDEKRRSKPLLTQLEDHPESRPQLPPRRSDPASPQPPVGDLIDLSSPADEPNLPISLRRVNTDTQAVGPGHRTSVSSVASTKSVPAPPRKPVALRSTTGDFSTPTSSTRAPPPPKPRKPSSNISQSSPLSQQTSITNSNTTTRKPPVAPKPNFESEQSYAGMARDRLYAVYNNLPSASSYLHSNDSTSSNLSSTSGQNDAQDSSLSKKSPPPPPPPRRGVAAYPGAAAGYVSIKANAAWQHVPPIPHPSTRPNASTSQSFSTTAAAQTPHRTNTGSTLGASYGAEGPVINKREQLWRQRWARSEQVLGEHGVVLRTWRVGEDAMEETKRLVEKDRKERHGKSGEQGR